MQRERDGGARARRSKVREAAIEQLVDRTVSDRSARVLTRAADAALAEVAAAAGGEPGLGRLAELLLQHAAVQDLLATDSPATVDLSDRLGSLAVGILDVTPRLKEVATTVAMVRVDGRTARWLSVVSAEVLDSFAADHEGLDVRVTFGVSMAGDRVVMAAAGGAAGTEPSPSLRLDRARELAVAMGGRFQERLGKDVRAVRVVLPCRAAVAEYRP